MVVGWLSGIDRLPHIRRAQQETPIEKHLNMLAIRALTARLPRASQSAKRFAAASHLQNGARGFSTGSDDDEVAATPVVEENGVIASIPIAQVQHCCLCCVVSGWMWLRERDCSSICGVDATGHCGRPLEVLCADEGNPRQGPPRRVSSSVDADTLGGVDADLRLVLLL